MKTNQVLLDPTAERSPAQRAPLPRPKSIQGLTLGLLDISKARGNVFLDRVAELMTERGLKVKRYQKPTFARVVPLEIAQTIGNECDLLIEALAD